eukprot:GHVN01050418.1.p1 GENE.GHVN01050418.1~~GHVN01050418.1.p1  ORF type:complete len:549 (+),score=95.70 GHVN01050418.1:379-2025(+)
MSPGPLTSNSPRPVIHVLDYGVGNIGSVYNALNHLGIEFKKIETVDDLEDASKLLFPGVGSFEGAMKALHAKGFVEPLRRYIRSGHMFFGICIGMQVLFEGSEEAPGVEGLGIIKGKVRLLKPKGLPVPHIGWNTIETNINSMLSVDHAERVYFVHSYCPTVTECESDWVLTTTAYGGEKFVSAVGKDNVVATQFHPEKSGKIGLGILNRFNSIRSFCDTVFFVPKGRKGEADKRLSKRVVACLDVRADDSGKIVVTKGDQYAVREESGVVRDMGNPVDMARKYYEDGVDELVFLNVTAFRSSPFQDPAMSEVLRKTAENVFIPFSIGGGIKDTKDSDGTQHTALELADLYFRAGADKASIGSDAVTASLELIKNGTPTLKTSIETISNKYGRQAVVISIDPKRVYVEDPSNTNHASVKSLTPDPLTGYSYVWFACTTDGGRKQHDLDVVELVQCCDTLGAGEFLLNSIDKDGSKTGFDLELLKMVKSATTLPVIVSSGAGTPTHFTEAFSAGADAALGAGVFHRGEVSIKDVKTKLISDGFAVREVK